MKAITVFFLLLATACGANPHDESIGSTDAALTSTLVIGQTAVGSLSDHNNGNLVVAQSASLNERATLQSLSFYVTTASGKLRLGVYDATGPNAGPGKKLAETAELTPVVGWNTSTVTNTDLQPGTYWLAYFPSDNNLGFVKESGNSNSKLYALGYGPMPSTFSTSPSTSGSRWSLYATLIAGSPDSNQAPALTAAAANPTPVLATSTSLTVSAMDDGGEAALTYTWSVASGPPAAVSFSPNVSNSAKSTIATFSEAGVYDLQVTVRDTAGLTAASSVGVTVSQTLTSIAVAPSSASVGVGASQRFSASGTDQFGSALANPPAYVWSVSGGGTVSSSGLFNAGMSAGGPFGLVASAGSVSGSGNVTVTASTSSPIVIGEAGVLPTTDSGNGNLLVAESATLSQPATLLSMSFYVVSAAGKLRLGLYDASGPGAGPGQKVAETAEISPVSGWNTANVAPQASLSAGTYWLVYLASDNKLSFTKLIGSRNSKTYSYGYGQLPNTFSASPNTSGSRWSLYATLNSSGAVDPCAGVSCSTPPAQQCLNATTLRRYAAGTCSSGSCSYAPTDVACASSCQNGACVGSVGGLPGPLKASSNPSYFQDTTGRGVALFGSHTWNNFQDFGTNGSPRALDFTAYTNFLVAHGHNFTMLWRTELPKFCGFPTMADGSKPDVTTNTQPWPRSGPGTASDGGARFDLSKFDQTYFDRLRARVSQLNNAGVWVAVYLFSGEWLNTFRCATDGYPLTAGNNVNSIDDGGGNGSMTMAAPNAITTIQDAMVDKTIDTLNNLPNVIWIVSEEASNKSTWWQQHMLAHVRSYEASKPFKHPVGIGALEYGTPDSAIINTDADWVSPFARISSATTCGSGSPSCKVNINDSDHSYYGMWNESPQANRQYAWENFARGNQVAFMDPYTVYYSRESRNLCSSPVNGMCSAPDPRWNNFRNSLGDLVRYSRKMNLIAARDRHELSSTSYCLGQTPANGTELLVYAPTGGSFTLNLSSASGRTMHYEWFDPASSNVAATGNVQGGSSTQTFSTPSSIPTDSVLYIVDAAGHG